MVSDWDLNGPQTSTPLVVNQRAKIIDGRGDYPSDHCLIT
jgi:hypothetical protein